MDTLRHELGDMNIEIGHGDIFLDMEIETYRWRHGDRDIEMETYGDIDMET
jgi:hypothetical protein